MLHARSGGTFGLCLAAVLHAVLSQTNFAFFVQPSCISSALKCSAFCEYENIIMCKILFNNFSCHRLFVIHNFFYWKYTSADHNFFSVPYAAIVFLLGLFISSSTGKYTSADHDYKHSQRGRPIISSHIASDYQQYSFLDFSTKRRDWNQTSQVSIKLLFLVKRLQAQ